MFAITFPCLLPHKTMAAIKATNVQLFDNSIIHLPSFTTANLTALLHFGFAQCYSNNEHQAAAHALLRHNAHLNGIHYWIHTPGGLHPFFIGFILAPLLEETVQSKHELVEASIKDLFDAVDCNLFIASVRFILCLKSLFKIVWMGGYWFSFTAQVVWQPRH